MSWFEQRLFTRIFHLLAGLVLLVLMVAGCGGSGDESADDATTLDATAIVIDATSTPVVIPTTTPQPSATPLPTATASPLEDPTPSAVLLATAFTNSSKVTTVGIDEVFFGMTVEEAAEAASTAWVGEPTANSTCYLVTPASGPEGITLWVVDGRIERLDIEHPDLRTPSKLGVGNTLAELKGQLGDRLTVESGGDGGTVATFAPTDPGDRDFRIIFELEDDAVVRYRSGRLGVIQRAPEGC